jgi:uncharacterized membrane protein YdjX (TVP38/TMEM64 family)
MNKKLRGILILTATILILGLIIFNSREVLFNQEKLTTLTESLGMWGPIILITILIIHGIVTIFPAIIVMLSAGILYGFILGSLYSIIGMTIGALITFLLARHYGRDIEKAWFNKREIAHFNTLFNKYGEKIALLGRVAQIFPADTISFTLGISKMKTKKFILLTIIGFLPTILFMTFIGTKITPQMINFGNITIAGIILAIIIIIIKLRHKIYKVTKNYFNQIYKFNNT